MDRVPEIFQSPRDYRTDVSAVEAGHATANEVALYNAISEAAKRKACELHRPVVISDLCSASGGCAEHVLASVECSSLYLVDNETSMIEGARQKSWECREVFFELADAVTWTCPEPVDIVLMNSAYHHIEDKKKVYFLRNAANMLSRYGVILVGEHFLPPYELDDEESYRASVLSFYTERIRYLESLNTPEEHIRVIRQTGLYCWQRKYEYQVSHEVFYSHLLSAGLLVDSKDRVWPCRQTCTITGNSGSYFVALRKHSKVVCSNDVKEQNPNIAR